jgi:hypothetical protein
VNSPVVAVTAVVHKCDGLRFVGEHTGFWFARIQRLTPDREIWRARMEGTRDAVANWCRFLRVVIDSAFAR